MDPLEERLRQFRFQSRHPRNAKNELERREASPKGAVATVPEAPGFAQKKVGPVVPPKPQKKRTNLPQIPQSIIVEQLCEPLYSQRLQYCDKVASSKQALLKKHPIYGTQSGLYDRANKVTLDNPAILEQQLEALAHHKKQLEKQGLLVQQQQLYQNDTRPNSIAMQNIPKLSSTSLFDGEKRMSDHSDSVYTNLHSTRKYSSPTVASSVDLWKDLKEKSECPAESVTSSVHRKSPKSQFSSAAIEKTNAYSKSIYNNILYESNSLGTNIYETQDEEAPLPPSPVSSSYSELRRATDVYPKASLISVNPQKADTNNLGGHSYGEAELLARNPTYMNLNFSNEYNTYHSTLHSVGQDSSVYYGYGNVSQESSAYESIYEPINPRPPCQISTTPTFLINQDFNGTQIQLDRSNNSRYLNLNRKNDSIKLIHKSSNTSTINQKKNVDVDKLTDLLVNSMEPESDGDSYGICFNCNKRVVGESSGCTAMDQIYHITCFTCCQCQINLQGKPFFALDGKPYCKDDYLQTLEKCSVCMKPILERILRATGKPYHPQCFTCVECGKSLDGIPFTVDATNQNYCIADFHKKFAPRCCVCREPIMPDPGEEETVRVVALDRSFHFECYKCEDCGLLLSSEAEGRGCYPLDDHVLCKSCNAKRVQTLTDRMTSGL